MHRRKLATTFALLTLVGSACSGKTATSGTTVQATEKDFAISTSPVSAAAGKITFDIKNDGPAIHEFVVIKTDLAPDALPTKADGEVDEGASALKRAVEVEDIEAGSTTSITATLEPGRYVLICNISGHYAAGMHAPFRVT